MSGPPQAENAQARQKGIEDALKNYPGIKIIATQPANFRRTDANQVMENLIPKFGDQIDAVIGANDETAMGALMALESSGLLKKKSIVIAGFDCNKDGSYAIRDGRIQVSYNSDPPSTAWLAAAYLIQYLDDGKLPPPRYIPYPDPQGTERGRDHRQHQALHRAARLVDAEVRAWRRKARHRATKYGRRVGP